MTTRDESNRAGPVVARLNDAIRDNPLAAGLIGAGVAWMLFGAKGSSAVTGVARMAGRAGSAAAGAGRGAIAGLADAGASAGAAVRDVVADAAAAVPSIVPEMPASAADTVADAGKAIGERFQAVASAGREHGATIQSRLSDSLERQPLLLGALGLAIGAGIASTFPTTRVESDWIGEKGEAARESLKGVAEKAAERAQRVVSDVRDEAARQGLTLEAAKDASAAVAGKVKTVAGSARAPMTQPFKPAPNRDAATRGHG